MAGNWASLTPEQKRRHGEAQKRRSGVTCADCSRPMWNGPGTLPQGEARCWPCRRIANPRRPRVPVQIAFATCADCGTLFVPHRQRRRYCSELCWAASRKRRGFGVATKRGASDRGYGTEHQKARRVAAAQHRDTDPCVRCGEPLGPMGPDLHYDHNDDRSGYLGFAHGVCNSREGARRGGRVSRIGGGRCDAELRIVRPAV